MWDGYGAFVRTPSLVRHVLEAGPCKYQHRGCTTPPTNPLAPGVSSDSNKEVLCNGSNSGPHARAIIIPKKHKRPGPHSNLRKQTLRGTQA